MFNQRISWLLLLYVFWAFAANCTSQTTYISNRFEQTRDLKTGPLGEKRDRYLCAIRHNFNLEQLQILTLSRSAFFYFEKCIPFTSDTTPHHTPPHHTTPKAQRFQRISIGGPFIQTDSYVPSEYQIEKLDKSKR